MLCVPFLVFLCFCYDYGFGMVRCLDVPILPFQCWNVAMLKCYNVTVLQCYSVAMLQCCNATMLKWYNVTMLQRYNVTMLQCCNVTLLQCYNFTMLQCCNVTMLQCYNFTILQCCNVTFEMLQCCNVAMLCLKCCNVTFEMLQCYVWNVAMLQCYNVSKPRCYSVINLCRHLLKQVDGVKEKREQMEKEMEQTVSMINRQSITEQVGLSQGSPNLNVRKLLTVLSWSHINKLSQPTTGASLGPKL